MVVAIFGCGPAGLFVAQAAEQMGHEIVIISRKVKSKIYGAQYLHEPIPDLSPPKPQGEIKTYRLGSAAGYAARVYKDGKRRTSFEYGPTDPVPAWNLRTTYDRAWEKFESRINHELLDGNDVAQFTAICDVLISTIPLWSLCLRPDIHKFNSVATMVAPRMEYTGLQAYFGDNTNGVVYNGTSYGYWYRTSHIFGYSSTEAVSSPEFLHQHRDAEPGFKVVDNTCDCHPELHKLGRMGKWKSGVLTHHAYKEALQLLSETAITRR